MSIGPLILCIAGAGALGGLANCALAKEFKLPHFDHKAKVWRPGWIGNVVVGAVAAVVVWGMYGPLASYDLANSDGPKISLTVSQLIVSIVIGLGGGSILTSLAERAAERVAKDKLAGILKDSLQSQSDDHPGKQP